MAAYSFLPVRKSRLSAALLARRACRSPPRRPRPARYVQTQPRSQVQQAELVRRVMDRGCGEPLLPREEQHVVTNRRPGTGPRQLELRASRCVRGAPLRATFHAGGQVGDARPSPLARTPHGRHPSTSSGPRGGSASSAPFVQGGTRPATWEAPMATSVARLASTPLPGILCPAPTGERHNLSRRP